MASVFSRRAFRLAIASLFDIVNIHLKHDPEKCEAVFRKDHAQTKTIKRDGDSPQSHHALLAGDAMPDDGLRSGQRTINAASMEWSRRPFETFGRPRRGRSNFL